MNVAERWLDHPWHIDGRGRIAETTWDDHIRDLIYQLLFTAPGERVNRPDFGCGVRQLLFQGNRDTLATATQFLVQGALQRWLGDRIRLERVGIHSEEERLTIEVVYTQRDNQQPQSVVFAVPSGGGGP
ncbi:MAG: GPW/gp25 family protein [Phycisphaerae bacterium]|nr:GPW/gp25 family protein [Phycisphaerae bacterium]